MHTPSRPFESLDWFHDASRRTYRRRGPLGQSLTWLRSARAFAFHLGLFALGCTVALAWNVARDPADLWVDRLALAWLLLLVIHAAVAVLVFALGLIGGSEPPLPAYRPRQSVSPMPSSGPDVTAAEVTAQPADTWGPAPKESTPRPPDVRASTSAPPASRGWANWSQPRSSSTWGTQRDSESETASWSETSPGAVIRRRRRSYMTPNTTPATPTTTTEDPSADG